MRWRTVIIVDVLAVAGLVAMAYDASRDAAPAVDADQPGRLFADDPLPVNEVTRITLARRDQPRIVFARRGPTWEQVEPFVHPLDPFSVRQLITLAADLQVIDRLDPHRAGAEVALSALGLDPPAATVTFDWTDGAATVHLGRRSVAGRAYAQLAGDRHVLVTGQALHARAVEMDPKEWRDRQIFAAAGAESQRIVWTSGQQRVALEQRERRWQLVEPVRTRLDDAARDEYLQVLGRARHNGFILDEPESLAEFGLDAPAASLTVTGPGGPSAAAEIGEQRLLVGSRLSAGTQDRYAMLEGRPVVVRLSEAVLAALFRPASRLVDPTGSGANPADVKSIRISTSSDELNLERDLERWIAPDLAGREVRRDLVDELLQLLTGMRASEIEIGPYPRELEVAIVTLFGFDRRPLDTVRIARDPDTGKWALENGDQVLRIFPASLQPRLTAADYGLTPVTP